MDDACYTDSITFVSRWVDFDFSLIMAPFNSLYGQNIGGWLDIYIGGVFSFTITIIYYNAGN